VCAFRSVVAAMQSAALLLSVAETIIRGICGLLPTYTIIIAYYLLNTYCVSCVYCASFINNVGVLKRSRATPVATYL